MADLASRIRHLRRERNMTQTELAGRLGVLRSSVSNWENALRTPNTETISKICRIFGVSADYLYGNTQSRSSVIAPPSFKMDITRLNKNGQDMLIAYYDYLISRDEYKNKI